MTGADLKRTYVAIRKIVPENIDIDNNKDYMVIGGTETIAIFDENKNLIYFCKYNLHMSNI